MNWIDYREKLGIGFDDSEHTQFFTTCVKNRLKRFENLFPEEEYFEFCNMTGTEFYQNALEEHFHDFLEILDEYEEELDEFLSYYIAFVNCRRCLIHDRGRNIANRSDYIKILKEELQRAHLAFNAYEDSEGIYIFPKGVKMLDDELISKPLMWLSEHPKAEKAWKSALMEYQAFSGENASEVADMFRKALEELFREIFNSEKALINLKAEYGLFLKEHGIPSDISNNFETLLQQYNSFNNNYAKHTSKTNRKVLEYLMYQTGMIMRLLITLSNGET